MKFKDRLRELRQDKGLTQAALASHFNKSESAVRMWETDRAQPDLNTIKELSKMFNCSADYLLGLTDHINTKVEKKYHDTQDKLNKWLLDMPILVQTDIMQIVEAIISCHGMLDEADRQSKKNIRTNDLYFQSMKMISKSFVSACNMINILSKHAALRNIPGAEMVSSTIDISMANNIDHRLMISKQSVDREINSLFEELNRDADVSLKRLFGENYKEKAEESLSELNIPTDTTRAGD